MAILERAQPRTKKLILEPEFAARLVEACDKNDAVPPPNYGRLRWIKEQLASRFAESVSEETVRRWLSGEGRPRPKKLHHLAQLLNVDEAWLALGAGSHRGVEEKTAQFRETPGKLDNTDRGAEILDRIRQRLGGTVRVAPGVDLTAPTGEIWDAERE